MNPVPIEQRAGPSYSKFQLIDACIFAGAAFLVTTAITRSPGEGVLAAELAFPVGGIAGGYRKALQAKRRYPGCTIVSYYDGPNFG